MAMREFQPCDDNDSLFYLPVVLEGQRYIVTFDVQRFLDQTKTRQRQIQAVETSVKQANAALRNAKKFRQVGLVEREVNQILSRKGLKKQAKFSVDPLAIEVSTPKGKTRIVQSFEIQLAWLEDRIQDAARLDGLTCFITNMGPQEAMDQEVIGMYRR